MMTRIELIEKVAAEMEKERRTLINQPLNRIWKLLAVVAVDIVADNYKEEIERLNDEIEEIRSYGEDMDLLI